MHRVRVSARQLARPPAMQSANVLECQLGTVHPPVFFVFSSNPSYLGLSPRLVLRVVFFAFIFCFSFQPCRHTLPSALRASLLQAALHRSQDKRED